MRRIKQAITKALVISFCVIVHNIIIEFTTRLCVRDSLATPSTLNFTVGTTKKSIAIKSLS